MATEPGLTRLWQQFLGPRPFGHPAFARSFEIKEACYGATAALDYAKPISVPSRQQVLVLASDIAKYGIHTPGEPTQGAGAISLCSLAAILVSSLSMMIM